MHTANLLWNTNPQLFVAAHGLLDARPVNADYQHTHTHTGGSSRGQVNKGAACRLTQLILAIATQAITHEVAQTAKDGFLIAGSDSDK